MLEKTIQILIILSLVTGCAGHRPLAPVRDYNQPPSTKVKTHIVAPGETLYSIAWRYSLNYKKLAKANNIGTSYRIYPGQVITLRESSPVPLRPSPTRPSSRDPARSPVKTHTEVAENQSTGRSKNRTFKVENRSRGASGPARIRWQWPASGKITRTYAPKPSTHKGIDIAGNLGEPVYAAAAGTVVYSGDGLRGFGNLIIIKHSEQYLSAYAHNHRVLVEEGQRVQLNDKIAEMGATGTDSVKLHFEIRLNGDPVNPLRYLPKR
jgi:lipoprotein NlpD